MKMVQNKLKQVQYSCDQETVVPVSSFFLSYHELVPFALFHFRIKLSKHEYFRRFVELLEQGTEPSRFLLRITTQYRQSRFQSSGSPTS